MNEVRIKLPLKLHHQWSMAAELRGLSLTSFITATISNALLASGELHQNSPISGVTNSVPITPKPVASSDPFASLPDPKKLAERLNVDANFLDEEEPPLPPDVQALHDEWDDED